MQQLFKVITILEYKTLVGCKMTAKQIFSKIQKNRKRCSKTGKEVLKQKKMF